jgi:hypothetical protein
MEPPPPSGNRHVCYPPWCIAEMINVHNTSSIRLSTHLLASARLYSPLPLTHALSSYPFALSHVLAPGKVLDADHAAGMSSPACYLLASYPAYPGFCAVAENTGQEWQR